MGKYRFEFEANRETILLVYLHEVYKLDLLTMVFLYEKFGPEIVHVFFLFAGHSLTVPRPSKLVRMMTFSRELSDALENTLEEDNLKDINYSSQQEGEVLSKVLELYNHKDQMISVEVEVGDGGEGEIREVAIKPPETGRVFDGIHSKHRKKLKVPSGAGLESIEPGGEETPILPDDVLLHTDGGADEKDTVLDLRTPGGDEETLERPV